MPNVTGLSQTAQDADFLRQVPFKRYEKVSVTFTVADTDTPVPYTSFTPTNPNSVRFLDIGDKSVYTVSTGTATAAHVYRTPVPWETPGLLYLRSSAVPYTTDLLLFLERG
jgi:hypothetical protein